MKALFKRLCCKLGWHSYFVGYDFQSWDGCNIHAKCKWCGYEGMVDSQGNLF